MVIRVDRTTFAQEIRTEGLKFPQKGYPFAFLSRIVALCLEKRAGPVTNRFPSSVFMRLEQFAAKLIRGGIRINELQEVTSRQGQKGRRTSCFD